MYRFTSPLVAVLLGVLLHATPPAGAASPSPPAFIPKAALVPARALQTIDDAAGLRAHNTGMIEGRVVAVDYQRATISVAGPRGRVEIAVLPSTSIQGKGDAYHALPDIIRGARVQVFTSQRGGLTTAQLIRMR